MKLKVEKHLIKRYLSEEQYTECLIEFARIIEAITVSKTRENLRKNFHWVNATGGDLKYFKFGFGGSHLWVKQLDNNKECFNNNIIFVDLTNIEEK